MKSKTIKHKIVNNILTKGKKRKSEKILLKSVKKLQKSSKKSAQKIFQLALISASPIFKVNEIIQKKRKKKKPKIIPAFIYNEDTRTSLAVKYIVTTARKKRVKSFFSILPDEFLLTAKYKSAAIDTKREVQKQALNNKRLFKHYRWH